MDFSAVESMPLTRKTRVNGRSIVVTIPSQIVELMDINNGELLEIIPVDTQELILRKTPISRQRGDTK
jgi:bifunctional DNA-binding transcriptional regulator/antitoxin component of YhaV-PrlF toxin-antitoxin module